MRPKKLPYAEPYLSGSGRAHKAKRLRDLATEISRLHPQALTRTNGEEADHWPSYPANFTKGLAHDAHGILSKPQDYACFVEAINSQDSTDFDKEVRAYGGDFSCQPLDPDGNPLSGKDGTPVSTAWRGWESPRSGHAFELQGPDAGAVGMAPAPRVGSPELAVEMAEVYALALLRDVPFTTICEGGKKKLCPGEEEPGDALLSASDVAGLLAGMEYFSVDDETLDRFSRNRRDARLLGGPISAETAFRGSTPGAMAGPYISQFMLIGANSRAGANPAGLSNFPGTGAAFDFRDGFIPFGSLVIDQRTQTAKNCLDYMTDWPSWLDVQNGANFKGLDVFEEERRFITTPRDLATYVHFDQLYEAYLNAALILLEMGVPTSKGFPEPSYTGHRDAFATFGGPHVLSLVCEIATRCLKAVRRQKFNYHRRARPEAIGGRLTLTCANLAGKLGCAGPAFETLLSQIPAELREAIAKHNQAQNSEDMQKMRRLECKNAGELPKDIDEACNLLLPMAFPEGSPMHPAYGAGHATVAGGCVTVLKAFFEMFEDCDSQVERKLTFCDKNGDEKPIRYVPNDTGSALIKDPKSQGALTIQGELDKLAANIAIGRNMAGVHYYSDYYDSLRMGERVAVGLLMEQCPSYIETVEMSFTSFDGDRITISGQAGSAPSISILDRSGSPVLPTEWWLRHVSGAESMEDL